MSLSPPDIIRELSVAAYVARAFQTVVALEIADAIGHVPETANAIAGKLRLNADALLRVLRLLSAHGVFSVSGQTVSHTPASLLLRRDNPKSLHALPMLYGTQEFWAPLPGFAESLRTGQAVSASHPNIELWAALENNAEAAHLFDLAMTGRAHAQIAATLANYDFSSFTNIGDIGGGRGHLISAVLEKYPDSVGMLFDLSHVVQRLQTNALPRLKVVGGDFFKDEIPSCDLYLVMDVIHDWGDEESLQILLNLASSAPSQGRLVLIERLMPDDNEIGFVKSMDIVMLTLLGGKQRSYLEFEKLLAAAGWMLERAIPTDTGLTLLEARKL